MCVCELNKEEKVLFGEYVEIPDLSVIEKKTYKSITYEISFKKRSKEIKSQVSLRIPIYFCMFFKTCKKNISQQTI